MTNQRCTALAAFMLSLGAGPALGAGSCTYAATEIPSLGGSFVIAKAINAAGQVAGWSSTDGVIGEAGFLTAPGGLASQSIGIDGQALGLNDAGQVVGFQGQVGRTGVVTGPGGQGQTTLPTLGGGSTQPNAINATGWIVGAATDANNLLHAFILPPGGQALLALGTHRLQGNVAWAINANGRVVGVAFMKQPADHVFLTGKNGKGMRDLGTLGGGSSGAYALNEKAEVVGISQTTDGRYHAFITGPGGSPMFDLAPHSGTSFALGINAAGQVVGEMARAHAPHHAFVTGPRGRGLQDLNTLVTGLPAGVVLGTAVGINDTGQIIAADLDNRSWFLSPACGRQAALRE